MARFAVGSIALLLISTSAYPQRTIPKPQEVLAPYWSAEPGWETELQLKNNLASGSLTVTPVLRLNDGTEFPLDPVTIASNAAASVQVNQVLLRKFPSLLDLHGAFGSVAFRFNSLNAANLHALVSVQKQGEPMGFHINAYPAGDRERAGSREGVWWQPRPGVKDLLVIANGSDKTIRGTLWLSDAAGKRWSNELTLIPYQTLRLSIGALVRKAGLSGSYGGISFEVPASAQVIDGVHILYDERSRFSGLMKMVDRNPNATLYERTGSDNKPWTLWAPMLAMTAPDPAAGFPAETVLQPTILVRNITAKKQSASITLTWRGDASKGQARLPALSLAPFETRQIQVGATQKQLGIPSDAHWALVTLTTSAMPDELIAAASSYDATLRYGMQAPFFSGLGNHFVGGEWRVDTTHNELMAVANVGTRATDALLTLYYNDGREKYELQQPIAPGDQMWVNLSQLIRNRVPDRKGNTLPVDVSAVTYELRDLTHRGHGLIANALTLDSSFGFQVGPDHLSCCGEDSPDWNPDAIDLIIGDTEYGSILGINQCTGQPTDISSEFTDWWSGNSGVATVTTKQVHGVAAGFTAAYASGYVTEGNGSYCTVVQEQVTAPVYVGPYKVEPINVNSQGTFPPGDCPTGGSYAGFVKYVTNQVQHQNGAAYAVSGLTAADTITVGSRHDLGSGTSTGQATTTGDGSFQDRYSICSSACPGSGGETDALQNWTVNGLALPHADSVIYKCTSISIDGQ